MKFDVWDDKRQWFDNEHDSSATWLIDQRGALCLYSKEEFYPEHKTDRFSPVYYIELEGVKYRAGDVYKDSRGFKVSISYDDYLGFEVEWGHGMLAMDIEELKEWNILGNKYENPELL